jgi:hypothetical protein
MEFIVSVIVILLKAWYSGRLKRSTSDDESSCDSEEKDDVDDFI